MFRFNILFVFFLLSHSYILGQTDDDNVIITQKEVTYEYLIEKGNVVVKEKYEATFEATRMATNTSVYEMYDNESTIDKVRIRSIKGLAPQYSLYKSNDIFYSDAKICYMDLHFDKKGKTGRVEFEKTIKDPRYFTVIPLLEYGYFIKNKTVRIVVPSWMECELVDYNFNDNIKKTVETDPKTNAQIYVYTLENQEAIVSESMMQGVSHIYPLILVLNKQSDVDGVQTVYFKTLKDQYQWYKHLVNEMHNDKKIIEEKAKEITQKSTDDFDKIKDVFAWVQSNIRYVAFEDGIAGFKPDDAHEVLRKKYGDCKGMANLTKSLLESLGFDARLTWLGTNHIAYDYSTPNLSVDNHMICTLFFNDEVYYLDATYEYMPVGEYPQSIQGRQVMIENGDEYILNRIPVLDSKINTDSLSCRYTIDNDKMNGETIHYFMGESKEKILSLIYATPKNKLNEALLYFAKNGEVQNEVTNIQLNDATAKVESTHLAYNIEKNSDFQKLDKDIYIGMNPMKEFSSHIINIEKRKNNILFPYCYRIVRNIDLVIPENYHLSHMPENMVIDRDSYIFSINYEQKGDTLSYRCILQFKSPLIKKEAFEQWNADINELKRNYMEQIVLTLQ